MKEAEMVKILRAADKIFHHHSLLSLQKLRKEWKALSKDWLQEESKGLGSTFTKRYLN
jgi:hypothetical protein